jgi:hypothetical protein
MTTGSLSAFPCETPQMAHKIEVDEPQTLPEMAWINGHSASAPAFSQAC